MGRLISHKATADDAGKRLDVVLGSLGQVGSRSQAAQACEAGRVLIGGVPATKKQAVCEGDLIIIELEDEGRGLVPEPIPLDIRYEDEHLLVLSKPAGLISPGHPGFRLALSVWRRGAEPCAGRRRPSGDRASARWRYERSHAGGQDRRCGVCAHGCHRYQGSG